MTRPNLKSLKSSMIELKEYLKPLSGYSDMNCHRANSKLIIGEGACYGRTEQGIECLAIEIFDPFNSQKEVDTARKLFKKGFKLFNKAIENTGIKYSIEKEDILPDRYSCVVWYQVKEKKLK